MIRSNKFVNVNNNHFLNELVQNFLLSKEIGDNYNPKTTEAYVHHLSLFKNYEKLYRLASLPCKMELGRIAEENFMKWLDETGLPYIYLDQTPKTLPAVFRKITKRPDFIVKVTDEQTISVDVKYRTIDPVYKNFGINEESDILRLKSFEDIFGIPVWFAICSYEGAFLTWYWIKLDKIILEMPLVVNKATNKPFRCISIKKTLRVGKNSDLFIGEILKN